MKVIFAALFCLILIGAGFGQKAKFESHTIYELDAMVEADGRSGYYVDYDQPRNTSTVGSPNQSLDDLSGKSFVNKLFMGFYFKFAGKVIKQSPLKYFIVINASHEDGEVLKDKELSFLADGKPVTVGTGYRDRNKIGEDVYYAIPAAAFEQIANSKEIKYKIGEEEGLFSLTIIRDLQEIYKLSH